VRCSKKNVGVDPIHFGILFAVCSEVGFLTPPLGVNLYVASALTDLTIEKIARDVLVFIAVMFLAIVLFTLNPKISLFGAEFFMRITH
jgi:C4-dicarboxylate transporter DctM subunit